MLTVRSARGAGSLRLSAAMLVIAGVALASTAASGATYTWQAASGDWSVASNWGGALPTSADTALIDNSGTASVALSGATCSTLTLGDSGGSGTLNMTGGSLYAASALNCGQSGIGSFFQSSGTATLGGSGLGVGLNTGSSGSYSLSGSGMLTASTENVGSSGSGAFTQTGGTNATSNSINIGAGYGGSGLYTLSGSGLLTAHYEYIGSYGTFAQSGGANSAVELHVGNNTAASGTYDLTGGSLAAVIEYVGYFSRGVFNQSGGSAAIANSLYLGCAGSSGTYSLSNTGMLSAAHEYVTFGLFQQSGGSNSAASLAIGNNGRYVLSGGTLQLAGANLYSNAGTLDGGNGPGVLSIAGSSIVDLSQGSLLNTSPMTVAVGPWSLLIVPPSINPPTSFASYSNAGVLYTRGSTLTVPAGTGFTGTASIADPVICQGSILASGGAINLNGGLQLSGTGVVSLLNGTLTTNNAASSVSAGYLSANNLTVAGTGSFIQTGGTNSTNSLYLNSSSGSSGSYSLSGAGVLAGSSEYIGKSGVGSFVHSGGTNTVSGSLYVGYNSATASGTYSLAGSGMLNAPNEYIGNSGSAVFTQTGGTNSASNFFYLGYNSGSSGSYTLSGSGLLTTNNQCIGYRGSGTFMQTGGTNSATSLQLGNVGGSGTYNLSGGSLAAVFADVGLGGSGAFNQSGGTITLQDLAVGIERGTYGLTGGSLTTLTDTIGISSGAGTFSQSGGSHSISSELVLGQDPGSTAVYSLSGSGLLSCPTELVGRSNSASALFLQSGGSNSTAKLAIGGNSRYVLGGGTLQLTAGGLYSNAGTLDGGNGPGVLSTAGSSNVDFSQGSLLNTASMTVAVGPWSLLIVPPSINPLTSFASYSNAGLLYTRGSPLTVPAGMGFSGTASISDPVTCQGSILASGGAINLSGGLQLSGTCVVNLGSGTLTINNAVSSVSAGYLLAYNQVVGNSGTGSFVQSGGTNSTYSLYLGYNSGSSGSYALSGSGLLRTSNQYIGYSGSGSFSQSGGTNQAYALYVGYDPAASALYQQSGGTNDPWLLSIGRGGRYLLAGGLLQFASFSTFTSAGTLDCDNAPGTLSFGGSTVVDLSQGTLINTSSTALNVGSNSLLIVPAGLNPATAFASYSNSGSLHVRGTTFSILPGQSYNLAGTIPDMVDCQGSLTCYVPLTLNGGLALSGSGSVNLSTGTLTTENATSVMSGGYLYVGYQCVGFASTGAFTQSGGTNPVSTLYLGNNPGSNGIYNLNGGLVSGSALYIGNSGAGTFNQSGGTCSPNEIFLGYAPGGLGTCQLSGSGLMSEGWAYVGYQGAGVFSQSGGTHSASILDMAVQTKSSSGCYNLSNGSLNAGWETIGDYGSATFVQSGGTHSVTYSFNLGNYSGASGTFMLSGGSLCSSTQYLGYSGTGTLTQTGGTNATSGALMLGFFSGSSGSCNLGGGLLTAGTENVGYGGTGVFSQSGGTNVVATRLCVSGPYGSGTYSLSGSGVLVAPSQYVGCNWYTGVFNQSGGSNSTSSFAIGQNGKYTFSGGTLQLAAGATFSNSGTFDGGGGTGVLNFAGSSIFDITQGTVQNIASMAVSLGPGSLLIAPSGFNSNTTFGRYSNAGLLYTRGTPLTVPAGQGFYGTGSLSDQVICQGSIVALGGPINLSGGLQLSDSGTVNLGNGTLTSQDATSGIASGSLSAACQRLAPSGTGLFTQSGGNSLVSSLSIGSGGRYLLSGGTLQLTAGGTFLSSGTLDGGNSAAALNIAGSSVLDLSSETLVSTGSTQLSLGPASLLIVPASMNPATVFGSYSNAGMLYTRGSPLTVAAGQGFFGTASITDPVDCQGSIVALGGPINLSAALTLGGTGIAYLGSGGLSLASGTSTISGGSLAAFYEYLGKGGTCAVVQSGGTNSVTSGLSLGYSSGGSGAYYLNGGLLRLAGLSIGSGSGSFSFGGGTLQAATSFATSAAIALSSGAATIDIGAYSTTFSGSLSGSGSLVKAGSGTLVLSNTANTYTGSTQLSAGTLSFNNGGSLGSGSIVFAGGALQWGGGNTLDVSARVAPIAAGVAAGIDTKGNNVTFASSLSGDGGLTKLGNGALTLANSNTISGTITLSGGSLVLANSAALPNNALVDNAPGGLGFGNGVTAVQFASLAGSGGLALRNTAGSPVLLTVGGNNASTTYTGQLTGSGSLTKIGSGKLTIGAGSTNMNTLLEYSGMTNVNGGTLELLGGPNDVGVLAAGSTVNVGSGATLQLSHGDSFGYYSTAAAAVNLNGGVMIASATMDGYKTWTTLPPINLTGGTMTVANDYYVPPGVMGWGMWQYIIDGDVTTFASSATSQITAPEIDLKGNPTLSRTAVFNVARGTAPVDLVVSAHLVVDPSFGGAYPGLIKNGPGSMQLTDVVECPVIVNAGTVIAIGSGMARSDVTLAGGGTLAVAGTGSAGDLQINSLSGSGAVVLQQGGLLVGSATSSSAFSGDISGGGGLTLTGGMLVLSGSDSYLGGTVVSGGTLEVVNRWSLPDGGNLTVGAGAAQAFPAPVVELAAATVAVPEPGTLTLLATIACVLALCHRRFGLR